MRIARRVIIGLACVLFSAAFLEPPATAADDVVFLCPPCNMPCDQTVHPVGGTCEACGMHLLAGFPEIAGKSQRGHFQHTRGKTVAILLVPGVEIIDFGPQYEIFGQAHMRVFTVAERDTMLETAMGMRVVPHYTFDTAPDADIVVLPGGHVEDQNPRVLAWVRRAHDRATTVLSVCSGVFYLARAGLLDGKTATTFRALLDELQAAAPRATVVDDRRFVDNGKIVTSAGLAAGIDAAFHVLAKYEGVGRAQEVATHMEYNWDSEGRYVRAQLADVHVRPIDDAMSPFLLETTRYAGDRTQWVLEAKLTTELIAIDRIALLLERQWQSTPGWTKSRQQGRDSEWSLQEANGTRWKGDLRFVPSGKDFIVTVSVQKT